MQRIWSIQYLRGGAALAVVVFHALDSSNYKFGIGAAGVDVFFVISGFIMASLMLSSETRPGLFASRRLARIVPIYWLATAAALIVEWTKPDFFHNMDAGAANALLSLAFIPHQSSSGASPVLWQGWTLEYEMFFYALCTLSLFLPAPNRLKLLTAFLVLLCAIGFAISPSDPIARVYTSPLLLEFTVGIGLAAAWRSGLMPSAWIGVAAMIAGLGAYVALHTGILSYSGIRIIDWGIPAMLIVAGALCLEAKGNVTQSRFGLLLGDASYALYLTHTFVVAAFLWFFSDVSLWVRVPACMAGSILVAIAVHLAVERPIMRALRPARTARTAPS